MMDLNVCSHCLVLARYNSSWGVPGSSDTDKEAEWETAARFSLGTRMRLLPCKIGTMSPAFVCSQGAARSVRAGKSLGASGEAQSLPRVPRTGCSEGASWGLYQYCLHWKSYGCLGL